MPDILDFVLRYAVFAAIHSTLAVPAFRARLAALTGKPLSRYRLYYNLLSFLLLAWLLSAWPSPRVLYIVPGIGSLVLYLLQLLLLLAMLHCLKQTGLTAFLGLSRQPSAPELLVTSGWYAVVRHPLYLLGILFCAANPVMTSRWLTFTLISTTYMLIGAVIEERRLLRQHGDQYRNYRANVPFLIPRRANSRKKFTVPAVNAD